MVCGHLEDMGSNKADERIGLTVGFGEHEANVSKVDLKKFNIVRCPSVFARSKLI